MEVSCDFQLLGTNHNVDDRANAKGELTNDDELDSSISDAAILLLTEQDVPGSSLDGKHPSELNVAQLRRWLVCRGAPTNGKKPELIERFCLSMHVLLIITTFQSL